MLLLTVLIKVCTAAFLLLVQLIALGMGSTIARVIEDQGLLGWILL